MKRRQFLGAAAGVAAAGGLAAARFAAGSEPEAVEAVLRKRLGYLKLERRGVRQFSRDFTARSLMSARKLRALSASGWLYERTPERWLGLLMPNVPFGEDRIVTAYLLSSDFFPVCDESRPVRYLGYFDALQRPNPFARLRGQHVAGMTTRSFNHAKHTSRP